MSFLFYLLLIASIVLNFCCALEQPTVDQTEDDAGWLGDVRKEEQDKHSGNAESPFAFNSEDTPKEFVCELFNRDQCDPAEHACNWQEICRFGEHNACYAAFTATNSSAAPDSYMVNLKGIAKIVRCY